MEQIKGPRQKVSLRKSLVLYVLVSILVALFLSVATFSICDAVGKRIRTSYSASGEEYDLTKEQGERLGKGTYISDISDLLSKQDEHTC